MKNILTTYKFRKVILLFIAALLFGYSTSIFAQTSSVLSITSTASPLSLPAGGGEVAFIYKVTNLGGAPLNDITVTDDKCIALSSELGDTNGNHLLDPSETWIYTCTTLFAKTTMNTATVTAYANGLKTTATVTVTVTVTVATTTVPRLPNNGTNPNTPNITIIIWGILGGILAVLIIVFFLIRKKK